MKTRPEKYVTEKIFERLEMMNEDNKYFRQSIGTLYSDTSPHDRKINYLTMRVDRLEAKAK